jgi:hypothetical protein
MGDQVSSASLGGVRGGIRATGRAPIPASGAAEPVLSTTLPMSTQDQGERA